MSSFPYALQLYSVRDHMEKNPAGGFRQVKEAGFSYVEMAGNYNLSSFAVKSMMDALDIAPVSTHIGYDQISAQPEMAIRQAHAMMVSYVVVPWVGGDICSNRDDWLEIAETMDDLGSLFRKEGLNLCYHNHAHEFETYGDETILDLIFNNSDPDNLKIELDLCWAAVGKADITALLNRYTGRIPLVHVKDCKPMEPEKPVAFAELGKGIMDWDVILPAALDAGAKWFIVEQDNSEIDSIKSARINAEFMHQMNQ
jgi:sugar phosphate isomerase/epimerase